MSETQERAHKGAQKATAAAASVAETASPPATVTRTIAGLEVVLPVKFRTGHVLTARQAAVLCAAYERQFVNNQNANELAKQKRLAAATTDAERAANQPSTAAEIAARYADYAPAVGDTPRATSAETLEYQARWNAYVAAVAEHNANLKTGKPPIFKSNAAVKIVQLPTKGKTQTPEEHKAALATAQEARKMMLEKFASMEKYAPRVEAERVKLREAGNKAEAEVEAVVAGDDIF